jgi:hypothetical protein
MQMHVTKQFTFSENQYSTVVHLAALYVLYFFASARLPPLYLSKPQYIWWLQASASSFSKKHYRPVEEELCFWRLWCEADSHVAQTLDN